MRFPIVNQRDFAIGLQLTVQFDGRNTPAYRQRVLNHYVIRATTTAIGDLIFMPPARNAGFNTQPIPAKLEAQYRFQPGAIHPPGGASVPGPTATSRVRPYRVDVAGRYVGL